VNILPFLKRNGSTILSVVASIGTFATAVLAVKATPEAMRRIEAASYEKEEKKEGLPRLTKGEAVKACWTCYLPATSVGVGTVLCILGSNVLNQRRYAALSSAFSMLQNTYVGYKSRVIEAMGEDAEREMERAAHAKELGAAGPFDQPMTFYLEGDVGFFETTLQEVIDAEHQINEQLLLDANISLKNYFEAFGRTPPSGMDDFGWSLEAGAEWYGYSRLVFTHKKGTLDDGLEYFIIDPGYPATSDYLSYDYYPTED
jgi:hypothetical protein